MLTPRPFRASGSRIERAQDSPSAYIRGLSPPRQSPSRCHVTRKQVCRPGLFADKGSVAVIEVILASRTAHSTSPTSACPDSRGIFESCVAAAMRVHVPGAMNNESHHHHQMAKLVIRSLAATPSRTGRREPSASARFSRAAGPGNTAPDTSAQSFDRRCRASQNPSDRQLPFPNGISLP
jgi:hypothetical protein